VTVIKEGKYFKFRPVADLVNRGISTVKGMHATCIIGLSINEDLKLRKRKGRDKQQHKKIYTISDYMIVT
jgi:hypothetical protein